MTIDVAIEIIEDFLEPEWGEDFESFERALRLAIEALRFVRELREVDALYANTRLPGEEEDGDKTT